MAVFLNAGAKFHAYKNSKYVILPLPYEKTSSYHMGSAQGPAAIIEASEFVEFYDPELDFEAHHAGIATLDALDFSKVKDQGAIDLIEQRVDELLQDKKVVVSIGAEHTVTYGCVKSHKKKYPKLSVLQLDAHSDLRLAYQGNPYSHASVMARVHDDKIPIVQVGIRAQCIEEAELIKSSPLINTWYNHQIHTTPNWQEQVLSQLSDDVYITIDADGFDPSVVPAVGTAEPGGLQWFETLKLLRMVAKTKNIVGFDVVECAPEEGNTRSEYVLAQLTYKLISYMEAKR